ncbi:RNA polymerase sigma factor [Actinomycetospora lemnae]|nr:sigma-70 family RNA polymerase sigma factor [Actinomycetospora sp. DW7H6]
MPADADIDHLDQDDAEVIGLLRRAAEAGWGEVLGLVPAHQAGLRRVALPVAELSARLTEAYRREHTVFLRTARAHVGRDVAEDVVQRAFANVWRRLQRPDRPEIASIVQYTCTAVMHEVHRELRAIIRDRGRRAEGEQPDHPDPATEEKPAFVDALDDALEVLSPRQRRAVLLRYQIGCSVAETAQLMAIGEGTVKRYAAEGLARLREQLSGHVGTA